MAKEKFILAAAHHPIDDAVPTESDLSGVFAPGKVDMLAHQTRIELIGHPVLHHTILS